MTPVEVHNFTATGAIDSINLPTCISLIIRGRGGAFRIYNESETNYFSVEEVELFKIDTANLGRGDSSDIIKIQANAGTVIEMIYQIRR